MSRVENKMAVPMADGSVEYRAHVIAGGVTIPWSCVCKPHDGHDHDAIHKRLSGGLEARGKIIEGLHELVGKTGRVGLIRYEITDCNIEIHGPARFVLYVAWFEEPVCGIGRHKHEIHRVMESPTTCGTADEILAEVEKSAGSNGTVVASAIRQAGEFVSK